MRLDWYRHSLWTPFSFLKPHSARVKSKLSDAGLAIGLGAEECGGASLGEHLVLLPPRCRSDPLSETLSDMDSGGMDGVNEVRGAFSKLARDEPFRHVRR